MIRTIISIKNSHSTRLTKIHLYIETYTYMIMDRLVLYMFVSFHIATICLLIEWGIMILIQRYQKNIYAFLGFAFYLFINFFFCEWVAVNAGGIFMIKIYGLVVGGCSRDVSFFVWRSILFATCFNNSIKILRYHFSDYFSIFPFSVMAK